MKDPLDPFSYTIDPPAPGMLNKGGFELPPISMPNTVSATGSGGMDPLVTTALISGGLKALEGLFGSGRRRREEQLQRREREQALRLARETMGINRGRLAIEQRDAQLREQQFLQELARRKAMGDYATKARARLESGEMFSREPIQRRTYRDIFTGQ